MPVTTDQLVALGASKANASRFVGPLNTAMERFSINTPSRQAAFLAEVMVESTFLSTTVENTRYTTTARIMQIFKSVKTVSQATALVNNPVALANFVYANRNGNGDVASGDGDRFRGRGLLQITGRVNYTAAAKGTGVDYVGSPSLVEYPQDAALTAGWYWSTHRCNELADAGNINAITLAINGPGMLEKDLRAKLYEKAKSLL